MHIHHHTLLQSQGGAARVAQILTASLRAQGVDASHSYEIQDQDTPGIRLSPQQAGLLAASPASTKIIHHLHATLDWPACLDIFQRKNIRPVITLHDCRLITGGCAFPLDCQKWTTACTDPCPQGLQNTGQNWKKTHALISALQPKLISPSAWLARMARIVHPHCHIQIIANGIVSKQDNIVEQKESDKKNLGINPRSRVVLFIAHGGTRAVYKGGHLWTKIWDAIKFREPNALALAVGGNEFKRKEDYLEFPYLDQSILQRCMRAADVLVYPSLADNHPLVVLEAMSCGLPCVSFEVGGIPEQIVHEKNGLLAQKGDVKNLVEFTLQILQQNLLRKRLQYEAMKRFQKYFTGEYMAYKYHKIYSSFIEDIEK